MRQITLLTFLFFTFISVQSQTSNAGQCVRGIVTDAFRSIATV